MKVLMLGWEYPPHISGGLGTACEGLTSALANQGVSINFVVPYLTGDEDAAHMQLLDLDKSKPQFEKDFAERVKKLPIPSTLSPYQNTESFDQLMTQIEHNRAELLSYPKSQNMLKRQVHYGSNIFEEVERYAARVVDKAEDLVYDAIHAHDWMTYPAGVALSRLSKKPLVVHVHSLEFDRSGEHVNPRINEIEKGGIEAARAVIAVSHYTASLIRRFHNVEEKIHVVHNGVYQDKEKDAYRESEDELKNVLFLGRITFQKGPDYFIQAALKVLQRMQNVRFVMAGSGDMLEPLKALVGNTGLSQHFSFPGFLKGDEVERAFATADLYVMPSVSEPFGISALEAVNFETPVILSKQSGVSEVLQHALKVDFWDTDRMADLIVNSLLYPELRQDLLSMARQEVKRLRWDAAASKTREVYSSIV